MSAAAQLVLLGPQVGDGQARDVAAELGARSVATVTAGRQEWEREAGLDEQLGSSAVNLALYERAERVWWADPELAVAHSALGRRALLLRRAYDTRLAHAMAAWMELDAMEGDAQVLDGQREAARAGVRALDEEHAARLREARAKFEEDLRPWERDAVRRESEEVRGILDGVDAVFVDGGHVPVLLNRLLLFGFDELLRGRTVVGCGGGSMALLPRIVLFHDSPPWGPGHAELGAVGLGLAGGLIAFPDGSTRLRLDDPGRVSRLARRFEPDACLVLDPGCRADWDGREWRWSARRLHADGVAA